MATKTICDRCGEEVKYAVSEDPKYEVRNAATRIALDLCRSCEMQLKRFLEVVDRAA